MRLSLGTFAQSPTRLANTGADIATSSNAPLQLASNTEQLFSGDGAILFLSTNVGGNVRGLRWTTAFTHT
jgi:hypothetical protein